MYSEFKHRPCGLGCLAYLRDGYLGGDGRWQCGSGRLGADIGRGGGASVLGGRGGRDVTGSTDAQVCQVGGKVAGTAGAGCRECNGVLWI